MDAALGVAADRVVLARVPRVVEWRPRGLSRVAGAIADALRVALRMELDAGRGHYATFTADTLDIEGELRLSTYDDFAPRPGQTFQMTSSRRRRSRRAEPGGYDGLTPCFSAPTPAGRRAALG